MSESRANECKVLGSAMADLIIERNAWKALAIALQSGGDWPGVDEQKSIDNARDALRALGIDPHTGNGL